MTKAGFLQKLNDALADLPAADHENAVAFYAEQLDDRIEEGMAEAEAVDSLGSLADIVAEIRAAGEQPQAAVDTATDERGKSFRPEPRSYTADRLPRILNVKDSNCAILLLPAPDGQLRIDYEVSRWVTVTVEAVGDTLTYTAREIPHLHFDVIGRKPVRVYLPTGSAPAVERIELRTSNAHIEARDVSVPALKLHTSNAHITAERITATTLDAKTGNARITAEQVTATTIDAKTGNGKISAAHLAGEKITLHTSNASLTAAHITAATLTLHTANGTLHTEHVTATTLDATTANGKNAASDITASVVKLTSSNGRIDLQNVEGVADLTLITSNASISATLPGSIADYRISSSGGNLPKNKNSGARSLTAKTSNGKINIDFIGDRG